MEPLDAIRNYFESMIVYKIASIMSTLSRLQIHLLTNKDRMTTAEMDAEIDRLEDVRRRLRQSITHNWRASSPPPDDKK